MQFEIYLYIIYIYFFLWLYQLKNQAKYLNKELSNSEIQLSTNSQQTNIMKMYMDSNFNLVLSMFSNRNLGYDIIPLMNYRELVI